MRIYLNQEISKLKTDRSLMETAIWVIAIIAVLLVIVIYVITSVGSYSNTFVNKVFKEKDKEKNNQDKNSGV